MRLFAGPSPMPCAIRRGLYIPAAPNPSSSAIPIPVRDHVWSLPHSVYFAAVKAEVMQEHLPRLKVPHSVWMKTRFLNQQIVLRAGRLVSSSCREQSYRVRTSRGLIKTPAWVTVQTYDLRIKLRSEKPLTFLFFSWGAEGRGSGLQVNQKDQSADHDFQAMH